MKKLVMLAFIPVAMLLGQGPGMGMFPWWDSPIAQDMNLSESQKQQIKNTVRDYRDRLIEQRAALQKAEGNLQDSLNEDQVNEAKANEAIEKTVAARGELARTISQMSLKLRMILTPQQWQELQKRRPMDRFRERGGFRERRPGRQAAPPEPGHPPDAPAPGPF
jgi:Spy/CpxP family protein refolding chaperone